MNLIGNEGHMRKHNLKSKGYFVLVFFLVYFCSNTLITQTLISAKTSAYVLLGLSVVAFCFSSNKTLKKKNIYLVFLLICMVLLSMIVNFDLDSLNGYILICIRIVSAILIWLSFDTGLLTHSYVNVMYLLSTASLIVTYVFPLFSIEKLLPVLVNKSGIGFYYGFLSFKINSYGTFSVRNYGLFSEPAVYSFYLLIAVLFYFSHFDEKKNILGITVICMTMITTFSPIGLVSGITVLLLLLFDVFKNREFGVPIKVFFSLLICVGVALFIKNADLALGLDHTLTRANISEGDGAGRVNSILGNFYDGLENPIFGGGLKAIVAQTIENGSNTTTTFSMFSCFGILFSLIVTTLQIMSIKTLLVDRKKYLFVVMLVLFLLNINNHGYIQADWYWIISLYCIGVNNGRIKANNNDMQLGKLG